MAMLITASGCLTTAANKPTPVDLMKESLKQADADATSRRSAPPPEVTASLMPAMNIQLGIGRVGVKQPSFRRQRQWPART